MTNSVNGYTRGKYLLIHYNIRIYITDFISYIRREKFKALMINNFIRNTRQRRGRRKSDFHSCFPAHTGALCSGALRRTQAGDNRDPAWWKTDPWGIKAATSA